MGANDHVFCSLLLDPKSYTPDTLNLNTDEEARTYWFDCFTQLIRKFSQQAAKSKNSNDDPEVSVRAQRYIISVT